MSSLKYLRRIPNIPLKNSIICNGAPSTTYLYMIFAIQAKKKAFKNSILCTPFEIHGFSPPIIVPSKPVPLIGNCRLITTQASANEQDATSEALKQILSVLEDDPVPSKQTYINIDKICKLGNLSDVAQLLSTLRDKQIFLSSNTYKIILTAASEENNFDLSSSVFMDLLLMSKSLDSTSYINIAKAFQDADLDPVLKFVREVSEVTYPRSSTVISRIIYGFAKSKQINKALAIFESMEGLKCKPDTVTFNIVLAILGKAGRVDRMLREFNKMKDSGLVPDIVTFNTLINCLRKMGRLDVYSPLLREMVERGINPDLRTYTSMIDGFGKSGQVEKALELFAEMKRKLVRPSIYVYHGLIDNLKKTGKLELAERLIGEMNSCESRLIGPKDFKRKRSR